MNFRSTVKNLLVSNSNEVTVLDIARLKRVNTVKLRSTVSSLAVNKTDSYASAGCADGSVVLINLLSHQVQMNACLASCKFNRSDG